MVFVKAHTFYSIVMLGAYVYHSNGSSKLSISKKKIFPCYFQKKSKLRNAPRGGAHAEIEGARKRTAYGVIILTKILFKSNKS
jgi:hypothetical protein